ncbi:hypothetical protein TELCIR_18092, partial [Teladorsagia circumcincta]
GHIDTHSLTERLRLHLPEANSWLPVLRQRTRVRQASSVSGCLRTVSRRHHRRCVHEYPARGPISAVLPLGKRPVWSLDPQRRLPYLATSHSNHADIRDIVVDTSQLSTVLDRLTNKTIYDKRLRPSGSCGRRTTGAGGQRVLIHRNVELEGEAKVLT